MEQNPQMVLNNSKMVGRNQNPEMPSLQTYTKSDQNELTVLYHILGRPNISRTELAKHTGLSPACIGGIVNRLLSKGLVVESGRTSSALGRKPVSLLVRNDAAHLLGVDIGSYMLRVIVTDLLGRHIYKTETESRLSEGRQRVLDRTFHAVQKAVCDSGVPKSHIKGIGVAHSGVVDSENGLVLSYPRPGQMAEWKNVPLRDIFEEQFGLPAMIEDSTRTRAVAEKHFGLGINLSDFFYISVGVGIGAAIFIDGKLYRGPGGLAGEFGHMTVDEDGPLCSCGNYGCLETVASCAAIIQAVRGALQQGVDSKVYELANGDLDRITIEMIVQAVRENDSLAFRVLDEAVSHIGVALADVANLLNPRVVIFGGPLFQQAPEFLLQPLRRVVKQRALEKAANEMELKVSSLGSEAAALGAAHLVSEEIIESLFQEKMERPTDQGRLPGACLGADAL
jgi:predicted NBD/HSP70 family sugar kinase